MSKYYKSLFISWQNTSACSDAEHLHLFVGHQVSQTHCTCQKSVAKYPETSLYSAPKIKATLLLRKKMVNIKKLENHWKSKARITAFPYRGHDQPHWCISDYGKAVKRASWRSLWQRAWEHSTPGAPSCLTRGAHTSRHHFLGSAVTFGGVMQSVLLPAGSKAEYLSEHPSPWMSPYTAQDCTSISQKLAGSGGWQDSSTGAKSESPITRKKTLKPFLCSSFSMGKEIEKFSGFCPWRRKNTRMEFYITRIYSK